MSKNKDSFTDKNIRPYLNEIAERLWSTPSHAAIMVGAGFSKNASKDFPDWATLGDLFFEKIHGRKPDKSETRYLNVLKLADEVQAALGRPVLNQLLRSNIPDYDSEPSPLHIKLLEFPWTDVFTTNYDTLIERACQFVSSQKFDIVINKEDLVHSEKPRIVKLHGSFPSERPFIITEEDYRTYPKEFAPFVNTVQQSLLENTLCLIGFSGDDPNFLQWIGWIRDNLGKANAPKIYLIGVFNLSDAQKKLLEQRNIVLVDFSSSHEINGSHYKALECFFDYLESRKRNDNRLDWPATCKRHFPDRETDKSEQIRHVTEEWRQIRLNYPGWAIVPEDIRKAIWTSIQNWVNYVSMKDELDASLVLHFAFELNWRLERCLCPIQNNLADLFESILNKYWPFKEKCHDNFSICFTDEKYKGLDWSEIKMMWLELSLGMLRFYREEGRISEWAKINEKLHYLKHYLSPEAKAFVHYERVLHAFFELDIPKVKSELNSWATNFSIPFWEAKRGGILAEIGQEEDAEKILDRALLEVREKLNLKPVTTDYSLVSQEATIMVLTRFIKNAICLTSNNSATLEEERLMRQEFIENQTARPQTNIPNYEDTIPPIASNIEDKWDELYINKAGNRKQEWTSLLSTIRWEKNEKLSKSFQDRWNSLKVYKCDPWNEIGTFENQLDKPPSPKGTITKKIGFDIGQITETHHMRGCDDEAVNAYAFLRYFEESGLPFRTPKMTMNKKSAIGALQRLADYSPYWTRAILIRIGDSQLADYIFSRKIMLKFNNNDADMLIDKYLDALKRVEPGLAESNGVVFVENADVLLAQVVPEILSHLCCKCSKNKKLLLFDLLNIVG